MVRNRWLVGPALCLAVVLLVGCAGDRAWQNSAAGVAKEALIREKLCRYAVRQFAGWKGVVIFIDYGDRERPAGPPRAVLESLAGLGFPVKPVSQAKMVKPGLWMDAATGDDGWVVSAKVTRWLGRGAAEVEVGAFHASEAAWWETGTVRLLPYSGGWSSVGEPIGNDPGGGEWVFEARVQSIS